MNRHPRDVAIVGMSCQYPGAIDLFAFCENSLTGSFVAADPVDKLGAMRPSIAEATSNALEDAGYPHGPPADVRVEIVVGRSESSPLEFAGSGWVLTEVHAGAAAPMVALDLGVRALLKRTADLVIVGGIHIVSDDLTARDGLEGGSGVGAVVLKRLVDAEEASNRIYAIIKGIGIARTNSAVPSPNGIKDAIRAAYASARLVPASVELLELGAANHVAELRAINAALPTSSDCIFRSPSTQIAQTMAATGMAGIIRAALSLYHRALPATSQSSKPSRSANHRTKSDAAAPASRPWIHGDRATKRRAGVNSVGSSGVCVHALLEEHESSAAIGNSGCLLKWETEAILLSAETRERLVHDCRLLLSWIDHRPLVSLKDLAFSLNTDRENQKDVRLGIVASSLDDLAGHLRIAIARLEDESCHSIRDSRGIYYWEKPLARVGGIAMLFPGEGSQYPGMLGDLCLHFPGVIAQFDIADRIGRDYGSRMKPSDTIFGVSSDDQSRLWSIGPAINAVLSSQWAIYQILLRLGLRPDAVCGHSSGEFLALAAAGAVQMDRRFEDGLAGLGAIFEDMEAIGRMPPAKLLAIGASLEQVAATCSGHPDVKVAMDNCPHQVVVAGGADSIGQLIQQFQSKGILVEVLPFERAYHTPDFASVVEPIRTFFKQLDLGIPKIPIYSCASAERMPLDAGEIEKLSAGQWSRCVRFRETVRAMHADGIRTFIDVGARGNLAGFVEDILRGQPNHVAAANLPRRSGLTQLNHLVAGLFAQGVPLQPAHLYSRRRPQHIHLSKTNVSTLELRRIEPDGRRSIPPLDRVEAAQKSQSLDSNGAGNPVRARWERDSHENRFHEMNGKLERVLDLKDISRRKVHLDSYKKMMHTFLDTQDAVMAAFGRPDAGRWIGEVGTILPGPAPEGTSDDDIGQVNRRPRPGPWAGDLVHFEPGRRVETLYRLDAADDPVAWNHTLGGRKVSAVVPGRLGLPVLPFAVMTEMLTQVAKLIAPGKHLIGLRDVRANKWIRYEDSPVVLEMRAALDPEHRGRVRAAIYNRGFSEERKPAEQPAVEGVVVFADDHLQAPYAPEFFLADAGPSIFDAERLYGEQWLFHGAAFQAVVEVGRISDLGIEGKLQVLPTGHLLSDPDRADEFLTDPIILDAFTHLLGCWGLDRLKEGDVIFPLRMGELAIYGVIPPPGSKVSCHIHIRALDPYRVRVDADLVREDGTLWMRISDWEDWRFHWPGAYRDVFRRPDVEFVGEPLNLSPIGQTLGGTAIAVWLKPPADMGKPIWRDVLETTQLSPDEYRTLTADLEPRRSLRLWGRMAVKEAARRLWHARGMPAIFPADLGVKPDAHGRPELYHLAAEFPSEMPEISIAHTQGVAVAIASLEPGVKLGIDVETVTRRTAEFESLAFLPDERLLMDQADAFDRDELIARLWCAKEALAKATGLGLVAGPASVEVVGIDADGMATVALGPELAAAVDALPNRRLRVVTQRKGDYVWAWTIIRGAD